MQRFPSIWWRPWISTARGSVCPPSKGSVRSLSSRPRPSGAGGRRGIRRPSVSVGYNRHGKARIMKDPYVEKLDDVWRIADTRVAVDSVIYQFRQGRSPEAIQDAFP